MPLRVAEGRLIALLGSVVHLRVCAWLVGLQIGVSDLDELLQNIGCRADASWWPWCWQGYIIA